VLNVARYPQKTCSGNHAHYRIFCKTYMKRACIINACLYKT
jgi:hypothetical protein